MAQVKVTRGGGREAPAIAWTQICHDDVELLA
jgi:hypothetical protein